MNDIPSIWMLLTLALNSTRLFSLPPDDGTDVRTVDADNAVFHLLF